jgi:hypothetical protein
MECFFLFFYMIPIISQLYKEFDFFQNSNLVLCIFQMSNVIFATDNKKDFNHQQC